MCLSDYKEFSEQEQKLIDFLESNSTSYHLVRCCSCNRVCIDFNEADTDCSKYCCHSEIVVPAIDKSVYKVKPRDIIFITTEKRSTILYLSTGTIKTRYSLSYWKNILKMDSFSQPHYSYIVNLEYVSTITKEAVQLKCNEMSFTIYSSQRKLLEFKNDLANFYKLRKSKKD